MNHLQWDNCGFIDGRKTLASYINNRETIDFIIWNHLCLYCMEEDIIKFSKTIDWTNCRLYSAERLPIYWYQKSYGKLPTEEVFPKGQSYFFFNREREYGLYDEKNIMATMFGECIQSRIWGQVEGKSIPAITYFLDRLKDEGNLDDLLAEVVLEHQDADVIVYLLRAMEKDNLLDRISNCYLSVLKPFVKWPWILFIEDWISVFNTLDASCFLCFFEDMEGKWKENERLYCRTLYEPFGKIWRLFLQRFIDDDDLICKAFWIIFKRKYTNPCKLMFKGMEGQRKKYLICSLKDRFEVSLKKDLGDEFFGQFLEIVLKNDEERKLFCEICN